MLKLFDIIIIYVYGGMIMKKVLIFGLAFCILFLPIVTMAASFSDVNYYHWAYDNIEKTSDVGVFGGYEDGTFQPEKYVSFLEIFSIIQRMSNPSSEDLQRANSLYGDVSNQYNISQWARSGIEYSLYKNILYESEIKAASESGILTDVPVGDSDFPSREQIAVFFGRFLEVAPDFDHSGLEYDDIDTIGNAIANDLSVSDYLSPLVDLGIFEGQGSEGLFEPTRPFRRAEMAKIVDSSLEYLSENDEENLE